MDITKRFDRILAIYFFLQSKAHVQHIELQQRFNVSERTIFRDLKALEEAGIPIVCEPLLGYSIVDRFRLMPTKFSQEEIISLMVAEKIMQQHETSFIQEQFDSALIKIKSSFHFQQKNEIIQLEDKLLFSKGNKPNNYLPKVLDELLSCILKKNTARIEYVKLTDKHTTSREIEPVAVFYEHQNWYVLAYCLLRQAYRNFRLDRIKQIKSLKTNFSKTHPPIQQLRDTKRETKKSAIVVRAEKKSMHFFYWERDNFGFEKEVFEGDNVLMYFNCHQNSTYFVRWFMMFVDIAEIVAPTTIKNELKLLLEAGLKKMGEPKKYSHSKTN